MIKKVFTYIAAILALTACTNDQLAELGLENVTPPSTPTTIVTPEDAPYGVYAQVSSNILTGDETITRTSLSYQYPEKIMQFDWKNDGIAVYAMNEGNTYYSQRQKFTQADENRTGLRRRFIGPDGVEMLLESQKYISCIPIPEAMTPYTAVPFNYDLQKQTSCVDISLYPFSARPLTDENSPAYHESEAKASAHLGERDILSSLPTTTNTKGFAIFDLKRVGAVVRFYIRVPEAIVYDSLQVFNKDVEFAIAGTLDLSDISEMLNNPTPANIAGVFKPTVKRHVQSLKLAEKQIVDDVEKTVDGMDFTDKTNDKKYYPSTGSGTGYIIAYMMMAPIDLDKPEIDNCTLYLCGHVKGTSEKKYYKATLSKPNLTPNKFYQWAPKATDYIKDEPITFEAIEIQKWLDNTTVDNGDDGKGTKPW